jgi:MFS family permease
MSKEKEQFMLDETRPVHASEEGGDAIDEKKLLRKIDWHLIPGLTVLFLLSFLDRSNGSPSFSVPSPAFLSLLFSRECSHRGSRRRHTHECVPLQRPWSAHSLPPFNIKAGNQFLTTLTIYFIGYILFEIPSNIVLKLTTPRFWLPTLTLAWGIVCTLMGLTQSFTGFLVARFFLGVAEAGFFPGVMFYLSMWYKRNEQLYRISFFFTAATLAGAFGGLFVSCAPASPSISRSRSFRHLPSPK